MNMRRVAFLTSGGDCQALNATMRGVAKTLYNADPDTEIIGILEGYKGLMYEKYVKMKPSDFSRHTYGGRHDSRFFPAAL